MKHPNYYVFKNYGYLDEKILHETHNLTEAREALAAGAEDCLPGDVIEVAQFADNGGYRVIDKHTEPEAISPWI